MSSNLLGFSVKMCDGHDTMIYLIVMTILSILVTVNAADVFQVNLRKVKRKAKKVEVTEDNDIWVKLRNAQTRDYEDLGFQHGIPDLKAMLRRMAGIKKREGKKHNYFVRKLPEHKHYNLGEKIVLECELKDCGREVAWAVNGKGVLDGKHYKIEKDGKQHACS